MLKFGPYFLYHRTFKEHGLLVGAIQVLFLTEKAYSMGWLQTGKLGQTPLSVDEVVEAAASAVLL